MEGSVWVVDGEPLLRVGPSVVACPSSLAAGVLFFSKFVDALESQVDLKPLSLSESVQRIGQQVVHFAQYANDLEHHLFVIDGLERPSGPQRLDLDPGSWLDER